jgi:protocatechuate 3,4-dioxygenase beta subunit
VILIFFFPVLLLLAAPAACQDSLAEREPIVGLPCEGCEGIFVGRPDSLGPTARLAPEDEPGEPMVISGTVFHQDGQVAPGVIVYAYQTNADGVYPRTEVLRGTEASAHGGLRGWARTDREGQYEFRTIRPGAYPNRDIAEHVHMHILEPGCCTYYLTGIHFTDDPLLTADDRRRTMEGRGGNALVTPRRNQDGVWVVERDIILGRGVPGYPGGNLR